MDQDNQPIIENDSLETPEDSLQQTGVVSAPSSPTSNTTAATTGSTESKQSALKQLLSKVNIYFIFLMVILILLAGLSYYAIVRNRRSSQNTALTTQALTQDALDKLAGTDTSVGDPKQTLSIESNAIFSGAVLVRGSIDVAGTIKVGGSLSLPGLSVGGTTSVDQLASKSLTVAGDAAVQGKLSSQNGLSVNGAASFSGALSAAQLTVDSLQLNKDLTLSRHLITSGGGPSRTNGSALGGGGTSSVSGNDTAGSVNINTGNSAPVGCFMTITFSAAFSSAPRVILSPASSSAASLAYYANRTSSGFSICTASDPPDGTSGITFDYFVIG